MIQAIPLALREPVNTLAFDAETGLADSETERENRLFGKLGLLDRARRSIPGGIIGSLAQDAIEDFFHDDDHVDRAVLAVAVLLIVVRPGPAARRAARIEVARPEQDIAARRAHHRIRPGHRPPAWRLAFRRDAERRIVPGSSAGRCGAVLISARTSRW